MNKRLVEKAEVYERRRRWKKIWKNIVTFLGCLVVFCTTYALILPAITLDQGPECGMEEHQHDSSCYLFSESIQTLVCQLPELEKHVHGDGCYEQIEVCESDENEVHTSSDARISIETVLTCSIEEREGHVHGDGCYESSEPELILICEREEHIHTKNCVVEEVTEEAVSDPVLEEVPTEEELSSPPVLTEEPEPPEISTPSDAMEMPGAVNNPKPPETSSPSNATDTAKPEISTSSNAAETPQDWEASFADIEWKHIWAEDVIAVAESQIGYKESDENYIIDENGNRKGYTRYGDWYGEPYEDWNILFMAFCLSYAEVPDDEFPFEEDCSEWIELLEEKELFHANYKRLKPGDVIFLDHDKDEEADHVGFVRKINEDGSLKAIEGDIENKVQSLSYVFGDSRILGFGQMPEKKEEKTVNPLAEIEIEASIYSDAAYSELAESSVQIVITGQMPEDVVAKAYPVEVEIEGAAVICAYDISLYLDDGTLYEPTKENPVSVSFQSQEFLDMQEEELAIHYVPENGEPEKMESTDVSEDAISFEATHFSVYAVTKEPTITGSLTLYYNNQKDTFIKDPAYSKYYNANSPIGTVGSFHLVGFGTVTMSTHTNGNVLAHTLNANSNFGTNGYPDELSYVQNYKQINGNSASMVEHVLVLGSSNKIGTVDNGNSFSVNGSKLDKPKNLVQDKNTATAPFIDLERVEAEIRQISTNISTYSTLNQARGVTYYGDDQNKRSLNLNNPSGVGAITFKASAISDIANNPLRVKGFESGHDGTMVINVDCTGVTEVTVPEATIFIDGVEQGTNEVTEFQNGKVIWNFINAEGVTINTKRMTGMVIAPGATVYITQNLNGTVVAEHIHVRAESHRTDFTGQIILSDESIGSDEYYITVQKIQMGYVGTTLPGAKFDLYRYGKNGWEKVNTEPLTTGSNGVVTLRKLARDTYYKLVETKAPAGYILSDGEYTFWIKSGSNVSQPTYAPNNISAEELKNGAVWFVSNEKMTGNETTSLTLNKVWLTQEGETLANPGETSITAKIYQIPDGNTEEKTLYRTVVINAENGWTTTVEDLPLCKIENGSNTMIAYTYAVEEAAVNGFVVTYEESGQSVTITNTQIPYSYELPETGGIGTYWYILCGLLMMAAAVICGYSQRRKRERRFNH